IRGVCKKYGFVRTDKREPITVQLLLRVLNSVNLGDHDERCCAAACVIGFLNCLRIGEFTVNGKLDFCKGQIGGSCGNVRLTFSVEGTIKSTVRWRVR